MHLFKPWYEGKRLNILHPVPQIAPNIHSSGSVLEVCPEVIIKIFGSASQAFHSATIDRLHLHESANMTTRNPNISNSWTQFMHLMQYAVWFLLARLLPFSDSCIRQVNPISEITCYVSHTQVKQSSILKMNLLTLKTWPALQAKVTVLPEYMDGYEQSCFYCFNEAILMSTFVSNT